MNYIRRDKGGLGSIQHYFVESSWGVDCANFLSLCAPDCRIKCHFILRPFVSQTELCDIFLNSNKFASYLPMFRGAIEQTHLREFKTGVAGDGVAQLLS